MAASTPDAVRLPLLDELLREGLSLRRAGWLDLGPLQPMLVTLLGQSQSWIHVVDLDGGDPASPPETHELSLPTAGSARPGSFSRVLTWDRLNYLDPAQLTVFADRILSASQPSVRIHALIQYRATEMPARPIKFNIRDDLNVFMQPAADASRIAAPRYSPKALEKHMPGLKAERTTLLNNGMQEYILRPA